MLLDGSLLEVACDNPCVVLYDDTRAITCAASYWNVNASLAGAGEALFLLSNDSGHPKGQIFTDNLGLIDLLRSFNQHFAGFESTGWDVAAEPARFRMKRANDCFSLECASDVHVIDMEWRNLGSPYLLRSQVSDFGGEGGRSYEVSSVIVPASSGSIHLDGRSQPGTVIGPYGSLPKSAFLAFCETWSRLKEVP